MKVNRFAINSAAVRFFTNPPRKKNAQKIPKKANSAQDKTTFYELGNSKSRASDEMECSP